MATIGYDMKDFKVLPFTPLITKLAEKIEKDQEIIVSLLEIKAYQGGDIFTNICTQKSFKNMMCDPIPV